MDAVAMANGVMADDAATQDEADQAVIDLRTAIDGLMTPALVCNVKSMAAKIAKPLQIPCSWDGAGSLIFTSSNAAVCGVSQSGVLSPMKAGIAVITITAPDGDKAVFAVTVTA